MQLIITPPEASLLFKILFDPYRLQLGAVRVGGQPLMPWRPKGEDKDARRVAKLLVGTKKWFNKYVATEVTKKDDGEVKYDLPKGDVQVGLTQTYIDFLRELYGYYEPVGCLTEHVEPYLSFYEKLRGEKFIVEDPFVPADREPAEPADTAAKS